MVSVPDTTNLLLDALSKKGKVVLLVDEYDHPIINSLDDPELAKKNREILRAFYSKVKAHNEDFRAVLVTGVTKFALTSLFSGPNILIDISLRPRGADLVGYTESEILTYFGKHLENVANASNRSLKSVINEMRTWYNGYRFSEVTKRVYNPCSVLYYLAENKLDNYWIRTAQPSFLYTLLQDRPYCHTDLEVMELSESDLGPFDVGVLSLVALLFQTGYLTIGDWDKSTKLYTLRYPNEEVRQAMTKYLLAMLTAADQITISRMGEQLRRCLNQADMVGFVDGLKGLLVRIPYSLHIRQERYYHSLFQLIADMLGLNSQPELLSSTGRIDMILTTRTHIFLFELKFDAPSAKALDQINDKRYRDRFLGTHKKIVAVGLSFHIHDRELQLTWEQL